MSITLYPETMPALHLTLLEADNEGMMKLSIKPVELRQAELNGWFFIQPELKGPMSNGPFLLSLNMTMELALRPDLIFRFNALLNEWGDAPDMLRALAWEANQPMAKPDDLLRPDSWLCLGIEQQRPDGTTGFRTLWDEILPHMQTHNIGPDSLDFQNVQLYLNRGGEDGDASGLEAQLGENPGQVFAVWPMPENKRLTPSVPIDDTDDPSPVSGSASSLLAALTRFLEGKNIRFSLEGDDTLTFAYRGKSGGWNGIAKAFESDGVVAFYSSFPGRAPDGDLDAIEAWINQVNHQLLIGNFEFDILSGELRFRTSAQGQHGTIPSTVLERTWAKNIETFDKYYAEISRMIDRNN